MNKLSLSIDPFWQPRELLTQSNIEAQNMALGRIRESTDRPITKADVEAEFESKQIRIRLSSAIRHFRATTNKTQEQIADESGLNRTYYGDLERGKNNISIVKLQRVATALGVTLSQLLIRAEL